VQLVLEIVEFVCFGFKILVLKMFKNEIENE